MTGNPRPAATKPAKWARVKDSWEDRWLVLSGLGTAAAGLSRLAPQPQADVELIAGLSVAFVAAFLNGRKQRLDRKSAGMLQGELDEAQNRIRRLESDLAIYQPAVMSLPDDAMYRLHTALGLGDHGRASLFLALDDQRCRLVGRHSSNPAYKARTSDEYRLDTQTCISRTWQFGSCEVIGLPAPGGKGVRYAQAQLAKFGIPADKVHPLTMKSRSYVGRRLTDVTNRRSVGVVIVESSDADGVSQQALDDYLDQDHRESLSVVLQTMSTLAPGVASVRESGF